MATNTQRIAALEKAVAALTGRVTALEKPPVVTPPPPVPDPPPATPPPAPTPPPVPVPTPAPGTLMGWQVTEGLVGHGACPDQAPLAAGPATGTVLLSRLVPAGGTLARRRITAEVVADVPAILVGCELTGGIRTPQGFPPTGWLDLQWCSIVTPGHYAAGEAALGKGRIRAYRCRIAGSADGVRADWGPVELVECHVRVASTGGSDHNDGVQAYGSSGASRILRCNIDCRPVNGGGGPNAAVQWADGAQGSLELRDSLLLGGGYVLRLHESAVYRVTGNRVGAWAFGPLTTANAPATRFLEWAGNVTCDPVTHEPTGTLSL